MGTLATIQLVADLAFCIVDENLTLTPFNKHDETRNGGDQNTDDQRNHWMHGTCIDQGEQSTQCIWQTSGNTGKNDDRDAVAETAFRDLFTEPHEKQSAGNQSSHGGYPEHHAGIKNQSSL